MSERVPLRDLPAERAVLGRAFYRPATDFAAVVSEVDAAMFWLQEYQRLYATLVDRYRRGESNDLLAVKVALERTNAPLLAALGGPAGLARLTEEYLPGSTWLDAARTVRDLWRRRRVEAVGERVIEAAYHGDSVDEVEADAVSAISTLARAANPPRTLGAALGARYAGGATRRVPTGLRRLDRALLGGMQPGYHVLAARTSEGKSALALTILRDVLLTQEKAALIASVEMSDDLIAARIAAIDRGLNASEVINGNPDEFKYETVAALDDMVARLSSVACVVHERNLKPSVIRARAHMLQQEGRLDVIVIDYLQRLTPDRARQNRYMEVGDMSGAMKQIAEELKVPVLVVAQLSRAAVGKEKPGLHHLRESGDIEQDADQVWLLSREHSRATLDIAKNRNGPCVEVPLDFDAVSMRFADAPGGY
jgi:replicative DNA helicase